jgi:hypothetical protein
MVNWNNILSYSKMIREYCMNIQLLLGRQRKDQWRNRKKTLMEAIKEEGAEEREEEGPIGGQGWQESDTTTTTNSTKHC